MDVKPEPTESATVHLDHRAVPVPTLASIQQDLERPLDRIPRSTWYQIGAECHNKSLSSEITMATPTGSVNLPSGIPRILIVIQMQRSIAIEHLLQPQAIAADSIPLLWYLYAFMNQKQENSSTQATISSTKLKRKATLSDTTERESNQPWQLQLLKSSCPEIFVLAFLETYQQHGRLLGFEREMPRSLMEAIDFELGSHSEYAKKAVYSLMHTLIACRRYLKALASKQQQPAKEELAFHKMALDLEEAFVAMEVFLDAEATLPKLSSLMEQEVAADVKANTRIGATVKKFGATPSTTPSLSSGSPTMKDNTSSPGTLRTTAQLIEQAQSRTSASNTAATSGTSSLSTTAQNAKIKVSNPLWSQTLGQNYMPQWPAKYVNQIDVELRRWFSLIAHVNGAAFAENLTALIKAVYPSDQKFLLDLILIEYMCLEVMSSAGSDQADRDNDATVFSSTDLDLTTDLKSKRAKTPGEKVVETIMSALVSLVIKPEDSTTYLEPGSKRWAEAMDPSAWDTQDDELGLNREAPSLLGAPSIPTISPAKPAALGGSKIKKRRNLYNRRVSPFYAILAMFTPKRTTGRVQGVLYLSPEEMETKDGPTTDDTTTQEGLLLLGLETAMPIVVEEEENPDPIVQHKRLKKAHKKKLRQQNQQAQGQHQGPGQRRMSAGASGAGGGGNKKDGHRGPKHTVGFNKMLAAASQQSPTVPQPETTQADDEKEEIEIDMDELLRAKEAETKRLACQAPFRVLMLILQNLTRVNQAGALDNWIADALSGTVQPLQIQYFQWLLRSLVVGSLSGQSDVPPPLPSAPVSTAAANINSDTATDLPKIKTEGDMEVDGQQPMQLPPQQARTRDTDEIQRLLTVLVATTGIGYDPLRTAYDRFHSGQVEAGRQDYLDRLNPVEAMLEKHRVSVTSTATATGSAMEVETKLGLTT
ncbi:hypothetical protein BGZ83_002255 [Gryganskiella cystojenkinii]|nr:hypothetical protein BGZ83_002255 [Gryganskiella cystojenkinii]